MAQYHDTVREELGEILDKLQEAYRRNHPNTVLLFATGDSSFNVQDVARKTSMLADVARKTSMLDPQQGVESLDYSVYAHNIPNGNQQVGQLHTAARMGKIEVGYVDRTEPERNLRFRMNVGFQSRVIDYAVLDSDGQTWHQLHSKPTVISCLEQVFSR
ncbi:hypothetical protein HYU06_07440 [Candidatus Woesearchaeota archaeon]|nr:hypothetical protein [Candidatus Woesearchaeota archaeon]